MSHFPRGRTMRTPSPITATTCNLQQLTLVVLLLTSCAIPIASADNVFTSTIDPATVDDGRGNSADENSTITFRDISSPPKPPLECTGCVGDGGIKPFLDGAKDFAHIVLSDYPYEYVEKIADGSTSELVDDYEKLIKDNIGLVICAGIGFLFIIIFPIVGCCFCCCRCCGRCGGSRRTDGYPKGGCARPCLMVTLLVLTAMIAVGGVLLLFTSDSISSGLKSVHDDVPANLDALTDFFNDTTEVIDELATKDLNFTRDVIFRDLDNIGNIFGGKVRDIFLEETDVYLDTISSSVKRMDTALEKLKELIPEVNSQVDHVKNNVTAYVNVMIDIKNKFETDTAAAGAPQTAPDIDTAIDTSDMSSFDGMTQIDSVGNLTEKLDNSFKEINDIPEKVHNESKTAVEDLKTSILDYTSSVTDTTDDLDFADRLETDDIKDKIVDYAEKAMEYDDYRKHASLGLGCLVLLIAVLLFLGLVFGVCGSSSSTPPHERGCASNSGGKFLIAGVVFTFIFGSLLMLFTTLLFVVGAPIESYGCVALRDTSKLDKLIDEYHILGTVDGSGTYLGDKILDDPNKNMTLSGVLSACKNDETVYKAFRVNESDFFNISEILDYKSKFSVKDDISTVNIDFSSIKILTPDLERNLKHLNDSIQYNFTTYTSELSRDATKEAAEFKSKLEQDRPTASSALQPIYHRTISALGNALDQEGKNLEDSMTLLSDKIEALDDTLNPASDPSMSEEIGIVRTAMEGLDDNLQPAGDKSFDDGLDSFTDRIFGVVDAYIDRLLHALDYDIGKCSPVWNTYNTIFVESMCDTMVASFNGYWFAIGWSLFFLMPGIVVAVKLSSHFRTMYLDDDGAASMVASDMSIEMVPQKSNGKLPPIIPSNKVGPMETQMEPPRRSVALPPIFPLRSYSDEQHRYW